MEYNTVQAKEEALQLLQEQEKIQLGEAEILEKDLSGSEENGVYLLKASYLCIMEIEKNRRSFWIDNMSKVKKRPYGRFLTCIL